MNLIDDPWIPVVYENNEAKLVGLKQLFEEAEQIRDLAVNPPQRIALMRLLLCITQAALDGPENEEDWKSCRPRIVPESLAYLASRMDNFNLYGDRPFLQVAALTADKHAGLDKLFETSLGDSPLFLEQQASGGHVFSDAEKALALLVFQNFSAGGKTGQSVWGRKHSESTFATPCFTNLFLFFRGKSLHESLWLNMVPVGCSGMGKGRPVWDQMPVDENDADAFQNAFETLLGRWVPLGRLVKLSDADSEASCIIGPVPKKHVFQNAPSAFRDPHLTVRLSKKNEHYYMKANPHRHIWREIGSLLCISNQTESFPALNLSNLPRSGLGEVDVWCGGLARGAQAAKIFDSAEWNFCLPVSLLGEVPLSKYEQGVVLSDRGERALRDAVSEFAKQVKAESKTYMVRAVRFFWSKLDVASPLLVEIACESGRDLADWRKKVFSAMNRAFEQACPHETPRQIQAFAQARRFLKIKEKKDAPAD